MNKKYELLQDDTIAIGGNTLYRIRAVRDFDDVKAGDLGGYIQYDFAIYEGRQAYEWKEIFAGNLSHDGNCWVYDNAKVYGDAQIKDNGKVYDSVKVRDYAQVTKNAKVYGKRILKGADWEM